MKRPFLAGLLALVCLGLVAACKDVARPDATGSIALHVTIPGEPAASGPARSPAQPAGHLTSATASVTGPTSKTLTLTAGTSNFTGTITGLAPGSYTVTVQGLVGTEVDYYGQTTGLSVTSGATANAVINFQSFIPTLNAFPTLTTWSFRPTVTPTTVPVLAILTIESPASIAPTDTSSAAVSVAPTATGVPARSPRIPAHSLVRRPPSDVAGLIAGSTEGSRSASRHSSADQTPASWSKSAVPAASLASVAASPVSRNRT